MFYRGNISTALLYLTLFIRVHVGKLDFTVTDQKIFFHFVFPVNDNFSLILCLILHAEKHDRRKMFFKTKEIKIFDISDMFLILHITTFLYLAREIIRR